MTARFACLHSDEASLVLECPPKGAPRWRHLGARVDVDGLGPVSATRTGASFSLDGDVPFSTLPPAGLGWFGPAALALRQGGAALVPGGGNGRSVKLRHLACVSSIAWMASLHTMQAAVSSLNCGLFWNPSAA